ncbi:MAG TPA: NTP transferase domain-containing protein, partial [Candidatus Sulfotelmatobacter sp.]|nr:NTP transferase domain-containing protein [Candidatus Sulfotelmatobacter sp.]
MSELLATVVLAGGKGTRMGSSDKHKACFEVQGVPVILRALETYQHCGAQLNVVVVGMLAESVKTTVNRRFPQTIYAFQDQPLGTGDAARKGAEILQRMQFEGNVLVVAGDKVIAPHVIRYLLTTHERRGADLTLATAKRPPQSSSGSLIKTAPGTILGILEEPERQRLLALASIQGAFSANASLTGPTVETLVAEHCPGRAGRRLLGEIWPSDQANGGLNREDFERLFS